MDATQRNPFDIFCVAANLLLLVVWSDNTYFATSIVGRAVSLTKSIRSLSNCVRRLRRFRFERCSCYCVGKRTFRDDVGSSWNSTLSPFALSTPYVFAQQIINAITKKDVTYPFILGVRGENLERSMFPSVRVALGNVFAANRPKWVCLKLFKPTLDKLSWSCHPRGCARVARSNYCA